MTEGGRNGDMQQQEYVAGGRERQSEHCTAYECTQASMGIFGLTFPGRVVNNLIVYIFLSLRYKLQFHSASGK